MNATWLSRRRVSSFSIKFDSEFKKKHGLSGRQVAVRERPNIQFSFILHGVNSSVFLLPSTGFSYLKFVKRTACPFMYSTPGNCVYMSLAVRFTAPLNEIVQQDCSRPHLVLNGEVAVYSNYIGPIWSSAIYTAGVCQIGTYVKG